VPLGGYTSDRAHRLFLAAGLIAIGLVAYWPALSAGFVFDDDYFLTANPLIRAGDGWYRFWCTTQPDDYWPVTSTTLWLEWRLWGLNAAGYHLTNLVLHLGGALLLWSTLRRLRLPGAYFAALLFAVHPVNVASVAWITQRKNLLALLFFLLAVRGFLGRADSRPTRTGDGLSLAAFTLGMLSKGSVAMLPAVLLLVLWWQRRLSARNIVRVLPFVAVAIVLVAVDIWFQHHGQPPAIRSTGLTARVLAAGAAIWFYLGKALWPAALAFFYPAWRIDPAALRGWLPLLALAAVAILLWRTRERGSRPLIFAGGYFCLMLAPALGLTEVGFMKYSLVADPYAHLALIGMVALAAAAPVPRAAQAAAVAGLAVLTVLQCRDYSNPATFYRAALARNPAAWVAHNNLGLVLLDQNRPDEAAAHFRAALALKPDYAEAHIELGNVELRLGRSEAAAREFEAALAAHAGFAREAHLDLGHARLQSGRAADAIAEYRAALQVDPNYANAHYSLGNVFFAQGRLNVAIAEYRAALAITPDDAAALNNLGSALFRAGQARAAADAYRKSLALRPGNSSTLANLRRALEAMRTR